MKKLDKHAKIRMLWSAFMADRNLACGVLEILEELRPDFERAGACMEDFDRLLMQCEGKFAMYDAQVSQFEKLAEPIVGKINAFEG